MAIYGSLVVKKTRGALVWRVMRWPAELTGQPFTVTRTEPLRDFDQEWVVSRHETHQEARAAMDADIRRHGFEPEPPAGERV